jgi:hypothetical protein
MTDDKHRSFSSGDEAVKDNKMLVSKIKCRRSRSSAISVVRTNHGDSLDFPLGYK